MYSTYHMDVCVWTRATPVPSPTELRPSLPLDSRLESSLRRGRSGVSTERADGYRKTGPMDPGGMFRGQDGPAADNQLSRVCDVDW
jgi:hypothetical protein